MATSAQMSTTEYLHATFEPDAFEVEASPIYLSLVELFRQVDTNED
ncbi:hypothetical protein [Tunturiibacter gelidiferens]